MQRAQAPSWREGPAPRRPGPPAPPAGRGASHKRASARGVLFRMTGSSADCTSSQRVETGEGGMEKREEGLSAGRPGSSPAGTQADVPSWPKGHV